MKKRFLFVLLVAMFVSSALLASSKTHKAHLKMKGKDNAAINCNYCHKSTGAGIPKKKGQDINALYKSPYCARQGCHQSAP